MSKVRKLLRNKILEIFSFNCCFALIAHSRLDGEVLLNFELALEAFLNYMAFLEFLKIYIEVINEPAEEFDGIGWLSDLKHLSTSVGDDLHELVRTNMSLEIIRIPNFSGEVCEPILVKNTFW